MLDLGETVHVVIQCSNGASSTADKVERQYCPRRLHSMAHHANDSTARLREPLQWLHPLSICIGKHHQTMRCNEGTADHESICSTLQKSATHYYIVSWCSTSRAIMNLHACAVYHNESNYLNHPSIRTPQRGMLFVLLFQYLNTYTLLSSIGGCRMPTRLRKSLRCSNGVAKHVLPFHSLCGACGSGLSYSIFVILAMSLVLLLVGGKYHI